MDIIERNSLLITPGSERVKYDRIDTQQIHIQQIITWQKGKQTNLQQSLFKGLVG